MSTTPISENTEAERDVLLSSLAGFIHSVVHRESSSLSVPDIMASNRPNDAASAGTKLVLALKQFITATACPGWKREEKAGSESESGIRKQESLESPDHLLLSPLPSKVMSKLTNKSDMNTINYSSYYGSLNHISTSIPKVMSDSVELSSKTLEVLCKRVYNRMPIRLLAFDRCGREMKLLERQDIFQHCAHNIANSIHAVHLGFMTLELATSERLVVEYTKYSILSHTWIRGTPGDVIYRDWPTRHLNGQGYNKISNFCRVSAQEHDVTLAWADTVCINKDSSTELDESIRSMYKWYRNAHLCVAYLSETSVLESMHRDSWFIRGWTLQELLASCNIVFYNSSWNSLGTDTDEDASYLHSQDILAQIKIGSGVTYDELCLFRQGHLEKVPISRRMQLAAMREVTREEDIAYSLMGILDVDISVAYGEGRTRAFFRLVRELVSTKKEILDIFNCVPTTSNDGVNGLIPSDIRQYLRRSPAFDNVEGDSEHRNYQLSGFRPIEPIVYTHLGLRIPLILVPAIPAHCLGTQQYVPLGRFYGTAMLFHESYTVKYFLMHSTIYNANPYKTSFDTTPSARTYYTTFGIFNFETNDDVIIIPPLCLSVPLKRGLKLGAVSPTDRVEILSDNDPVVFELRSKTNDKRVPKSDLRKHGLQLVTVYL